VSSAWRIPVNGRRVEAREAAYHINLFGRDVEIYEKKSGKVVELSKGVAINPLMRPAPSFFVAIPGSKRNPQSLMAAK
jgi:hypothetical protein